MNPQLAIRIAANAGSALGPQKIPGSLVRNAIVTAAAMERLLGDRRDVNLELAVGRALAIREDVMTPAQARDLVRSCEAVLESWE